MGMRTRWMDNRLALNLNYGYTHATFRSNDNFVPYVPQHTLSAVADFRQPLSNDFVRAITVGANFSGAGKIMWNEENTSEQGFYGLLGAHLMFELFDDMTIDLWGKNLTQKDYDTFRFVSMNRNYAQRGEPCHFGIDLRMKF
jgi:outer membrane receptor for ferric coprogen and ferric-rhodotorulic acid